MSPNEIIYALQSWPAKIAELNELLKADRAELAAAKAECERLTANQRQPAEDIFVSHLCDELARLRAEVELDEDLQLATESSLKTAIARAEKAEADTARLDWILVHGVQTQHHHRGGGVVRYYKDRAAIDAAMKGTL